MQFISLIEVSNCLINGARIVAQRREKTVHQCRFQVAKTTLQKSGISLHLFSSCPDNLVAYKTAYFALLQQLQMDSNNVRLESKDLQGEIAISSTAAYRSIRHINETDSSY